MTQFLGRQTLVANIDATFATGSQGLKGLLIGNESGLSVVIYMDGTSDSKSLYPGTVDFFEIKSGYSGTVLVKNSAQLNNIISWPSSFVQFDAVGINDRVNVGVYPMSLPRITNIGNVVTTSMTAASSLINLNSPPNTNVVTIQPNNAASPTFTLDNEGNLLVSTNNGGVLSGAFQIIGGANPQIVFLAGTGIDKNGNFSVVGSIQPDIGPAVLVGTISGTVEVFEYFQGANIKRCLVFWNNYKSANQTIALPLAFTNGAMWRITETQGQPINFLSGGVAQTHSIQTSLALAGGAESPQTFIKGWSQGQCRSGFDSLQFDFVSSAASGFLEIEGI